MVKRLRREIRRVKCEAIRNWYRYYNERSVIARKEPPTEKYIKWVSDFGAGEISRSLEYEDESIALNLPMPGVQKVRFILCFQAPDRYRLLHTDIII
jgi:hypothetical protein